MIGFDDAKIVLLLSFQCKYIHRNNYTHRSDSKIENYYIPQLETYNDRLDE